MEKELELYKFEELNKWIQDDLLCDFIDVYVEDNGIVLSDKEARRLYVEANHWFDEWGNFMYSDYSTKLKYAVTH